MTPEFILGLIQQIAQESPEIAESLKRLFTKPDPTPAEWAAERKRISDMYYDKLVPAGQLLYAQTT